MMLKRLWIALFALTASPLAFAHGLGDHETITNLAITEFNFCFNTLISPGLSDVIQEHVRDEDTNLFRKWALYAHFYNPYKKLEDMSRLSSDLRIALLQKEISRKLGGGYDNIEDDLEALGHAIHHIQDMTSPPHVVPVMHGLFDGFETYEIPLLQWPDLRLDDAHCKALLANVKPRGPYQILNETAIQTLNSLVGRVGYMRDGKASQTTWDMGFWRASKGNTFGEYGLLGNAFGDSWSNTTGVFIPEEQFLKFKKARLRDAIDRTVETLVWYFFHNTKP